MLRLPAAVLLHQRHASITLLGFACFRIVGLDGTFAAIALDYTRTRMDAFIAAAA